MTTAKKHMCSIVDKNLKRLLNKKSVSIKEFQDIIKYDYIMKDKNMCGVPDRRKKQKKSIAQLKKELFGG